MFREWNDFYLLVGGAAGALIGLLFVVVTLTSGNDRERALAGARDFMTPTVVMFSTVVVLSGLAMAPGLGAALQGALIAAGGVAGVVYDSRIMANIRRREKSG